MIDTPSNVVPAKRLVWFLGDPNRLEFQSPFAELQAVAQVHRFRGPHEIAPVEDNEEWPAWIVVAQTRPGEFSTHAIEALRAIAPLTPIVGLLGPWCEGERRSGSPWPGVVRRYWHQWLASFRAEMRREQAGLRSTWELPATATDEERLLKRHPPKLTSANASCEHKLPAVVAICCQQRDLQALLVAACRVAGMAPITIVDDPVAPVTNVSAAIWANADTPNACLRLQRLAAMLRQTPILALVDFLRPEQTGQLHLAGASSIVSKPFHLDELLGELLLLLRPTDR